MKQVTIAHLYPREMSIYGDLGNVTALVKRLEWRGYEAKVVPVEIGDRFDSREADIIFGGGGQDSGQNLVAPDLLQRGEALRAAAEAGMPMLLVCGLYQLFGRGFTTAAGQEIPGIGVFAARTVGGSKRMIGNVVVDSPYGRLVGFENHSGETLLDKGQAPLGKVVRGYGNAPKGRREGAVVNNVIGTYLHGPVLPKNPALADHLITVALERRFGKAQLSPLNNALEQAAADVAAARPQ